jgi:hypothetical protein
MAGLDEDDRPAGRADAVQGIAQAPGPALRQKAG